MVDRIYIADTADGLVYDTEPFEGAYRYDRVGKTVPSLDDRLVRAFDAGTRGQYLSDNPHPEQSLDWFAWRAGLAWVTGRG